MKPWATRVPLAAILAASLIACGDDDDDADGPDEPFTFTQVDPLAYDQLADLFDDVLVEVPGDDDVIWATETCVETNQDDPDLCDRKTCQADDESNCSDFGVRCEEHGHNYEGNSAEGECIRTQSPD